MGKFLISGLTLDDRNSRDNNELGKIRVVLISLDIKYIICSNKKNNTSVKWTKVIKIINKHTLKYFSYK